MGAACSSQEIRDQFAQHKRVERLLKKLHEDELGNQKLLLLGTGECGKSTILKQMRVLHDEKSVHKKMLIESRHMVYSNVVHGMAALIRGVDVFFFQLASDAREMEARRILALADAEKAIYELTNDLVLALRNLWTDNAIQRTFDKRAQLQIGDSLGHFMNSLDRIARHGYEPTVDDWLRIRVPTTGVVQTEFPIKGCMFRIIDVGGQRSERRKWIHHFDDVNAVIYICAINEFDQTLMEDGKTNRLQESMDLFETICNSRWFKSASMILFLNKKDLFEEKIAAKEMRYYFPQYNGDNSYESVVGFIEQVFRDLNSYRRYRRLYVHETCATDTSQVQFVIDSVIDTVIGNNLRGAGVE